MTRKHNELGGLPKPGQKKNRTPIRDREDRDRIEFDLAAGKSIRALARKYGVHEQSLYKHRKNLPPQLKAAYIGRLLAPGVDLDKLRTKSWKGCCKVWRHNAPDCCSPKTKPSKMTMASLFQRSPMPFTGI